MKSLSIALFLSSLLTCAASTNVTLSIVGPSTAMVHANSNQIVKLKMLMVNAWFDFQLGITAGTNFYFMPSNQIVRPVEIVGPVDVRIQAAGNSQTIATFELISTDEISQTPSGSVVIPADASGPVEIKLESSIDLITWTDALPGSYGSSTEKRFFRVRAVATQ